MVLIGLVLLVLILVALIWPIVWDVICYKFPKFEKRRFFRSRIRGTQQKIWEIEFKKREMANIREGVRVQHDRVKEYLEAAKMKLGLEKYDIVTRDGRKLDVQGFMSLAVKFDDIPEKLSQDWDVYRQPKKELKADVIKNLEGFVSQYTDELSKHERRLVEIDTEMESVEPGSLNFQLEGYAGLMELLREGYKNL